MADLTSTHTQVQFRLFDGAEDLSTVILWPNLALPQVGDRVVIAGTRYSIAQRSWDLKTNDGRSPLQLIAELRPY